MGRLPIGRVGAAVWTRIVRRGPRSSYLHVQGKVRDLLQIVKFYAVFPVFEDEATAVRSFSSSAAAGKLFL